MGRTLVNCVRCPSRRFALVLSCRRGDAAQARGLADHPRTGDPRAQGRRSGGRTASWRRCSRRSTRSWPWRNRTGCSSAPPSWRWSASASSASASSCSIASATRCWGRGAPTSRGKIVDEHHIMYDVSETDREAFRRVRGGRRALHRVRELPDRRAPQGRDARRRAAAGSPARRSARRARPSACCSTTPACRASPSTKRSRRTPRSCARCWERSSIRCAARSGTARRRRRIAGPPPGHRRRSRCSRRIRPWAASRSPAKLDISLSRLARVFKAEMGMSLVEYRNRLRLDRFAVLLDRGRHEPARSGARGGLRQLRAVPPRVPRAAPHDAARVPAQPQLTSNETWPPLDAAVRRVGRRRLHRPRRWRTGHERRRRHTGRQRRHRSAGRSVRVGARLGRAPGAARQRRAASERSARTPHRARLGGLQGRRQLHVRRHEFVADPALRRAAGAGRAHDVLFDHRQDRRARRSGLGACA